MPNFDFASPAPPDKAARFAAALNALLSPELGAIREDVLRAVQSGWGSWGELEDQPNVKGQIAVVRGDPGFHTGLTAASPAIPVDDVPNDGFFVGTGTAWKWLAPASVTGIATLEDALAGIGFDTAISPEVLQRILPRPGFSSSLDEFVPAVEIAGGAAAIPYGAANLGFTVGAAATGAGSNARLQHRLSPIIARIFAGYTIRIKAAVELTPGFLSAKPLAAATCFVNRAGGGTANGGTQLSTALAGNVLTREVSYTLTDQDRLLGLLFQVTSGAAAGADHSLKLLSSNISVEAVPAGAVFTPEDANRIINSIMGRRNIGPLWADATPLPILAGGAASFAAADGRLWGLSVPSGATGINSFLFVRNPVAPSDSAAFAGRRIDILLPLTQSAIYTRTLTWGCRVELANGTTSFRGVTMVYDHMLSATRRVVRFTVDLPDNVVKIEPYALISGGTSVTGAAQNLEITDAIIEIVSTPSDVTSPQQENDRMAFARAIARARTLALGDGSISTGNEIANGTALSATQTFSGAVVTAGTNGHGVTVPVGSTGITTLLQPKNGFIGQGHLNKTLRIKIGLTISEPFTRVLNCAMQVGLSGGSFTGRTATISVSGTGARRVYTLDYVVQGDEVTLQPYIQITAGAAVTGAEETILVSEFTRSFITTTSDVLSVADENIAAFRSAILASAATTAFRMSVDLADYAVIVSVKEDGTGDFTRAKLAAAAVVGASIVRRVLLMIYGSTGHPDDFDWSPPDFVDMVGVNAETSVIHWENDVNASAGQISGRSTLYWKNTGRIQSLTISIRYGRYALHLETSGVTKNGVQIIVDCNIVHYGNAGALNASAWGVANQFAAGCGVSSGQMIVGRGNRFIGPAGGFSYHTNNSFDRPSIVDMEGNSFVSTDLNSNQAFRIIPCGSGQADQCRLVGNTFGGDVVYASGANGGAPWFPTALAKQPADQCEIRVYGHSNRNLVWKNTTLGRALRIESANTGSGTAIVLGTGGIWPIIMGDGTALKYSGRVTGGFGVAASVTGWGNISELADSAMCKLSSRLGDRSASPLVDTISVDGGAAQVITLDGNYVGMTNAAIISAIQAQITGATVSSYLISRDYVGQFPDMEAYPWNNNDTVAIRKGDAVAWTTRKGHTAKKMVAADDAKLFAGIALENIAPRRSGRVQTTGLIELWRVNRSDSGDPVLGDAFSVTSVGGVGGYLAKSTSKPVAYAGRFDALDLDWRAA